MYCDWKCSEVFTTNKKLDIRYSRALSDLIELIQ
jgi:hypothetical protein